LIRPQRNSIRLVQRLDTEVGGLRPDQADRQVNVAITKRAQRFLLRRRPGGRAMDVFPLGRSEATSLTMRLRRSSSAQSIFLLRFTNQSGKNILDSLLL
jgi:hypothetical protein